jgi:glycosyltransferase involved in cell wall biosynthesis
MSDRIGMEDPHGLTVSLVTLGDPSTLTGGYLYHQRIASLAPRHGAEVQFVSVPPWPFPLGVLAGPAVLREVRRQRPDVLLMDSIAAAFLAPWLAFRRPRVPVVGIAHQPPGGIGHGPWRTRVQVVLDRRAYRHAAVVLAASEMLADQLAACGVARARLRVVPPGRDVASVPDQPRGGLRRGRRAALLCVGNWLSHKGIVDVLEAVRRLPADLVTLHLVGDTESDPTYAERVRALLASSDLAGRVVVHGPFPLEEVAAMYAMADVFVLASTRESYGTVYGEAMAAGLPIVGYVAGNLPNLARHEQEGLLVPPGNIEALAAALRRLAENAGLRRRLGAAAALRAAGFPTWAQTAERLFGELRTIAGCVRCGRPAEVTASWDRER